MDENEYEGFDSEDGESIVLDRICQNCAYFFQDDKDEDDMGICSLDKAFDPYWDDKGVSENMDFSVCRELYQKRRFDSQRDACDHYEQVEIEELPDDINIDTLLRFEMRQSLDIGQLLELLETRPGERREVLHTIYMQIRDGNQEASDRFFDYYNGLGPAASLEDVAYRIEIVTMLSWLPRDEHIVAAYVRELARTPSNNTTRRLYTEILSKLERYPEAEICAPLEKLLAEVPYSYRIKRRIREVAGLIRSDDDWERNVFLFFANQDGDEKDT